MERRDFLAIWIQALLLAFFPFLRTRPVEQSHEIAKAIVDKMHEGDAVTEYTWWMNYATWNMVRGYNLRWTIGQSQQLLDEKLHELVRLTAYVPQESFTKAMTL